LVQAELAILEDAPPGEIIVFLHSDPPNRHQRISEILRQGGIITGDGILIEIN
jgi:hypothetical protein